jgi:hypothetical protein
LKKPEYIMFFENGEDLEGEPNQTEESLGLRDEDIDEFSAIGMAKKRKRGFYYYPINGINVLRKRRRGVDVGISLPPA